MVKGSRVEGEEMTTLTAESIAADLGLEAAMNGGSRESNPYSPRSSLYAWWDIGWLEYEDNTVEGESA